MEQYQSIPMNYYQNYEYNGQETYEDINTFKSANLYQSNSNYEFPIRTQQNKKIFQYNCIRGPQRVINSRIYFRAPICTCNYQSKTFQNKYGKIDVSKSNKYITICPYCGYEIKKDININNNKNQQTPHNNQRIYVMPENKKNLVAKLCTCKKININTFQGNNQIKQNQLINQGMNTINNLNINTASQTIKMNNEQYTNLNQENNNLQEEIINNNAKIDGTKSAYVQTEMKDLVNYNEENEQKDINNEDNNLNHEKFEINNRLNLEEKDKNNLDTINEIINNEKLNLKEQKIDSNNKNIEKLKDNLEENINLNDNKNINDIKEKNESEINEENSKIEGKDEQHEQEQIIEENDNIKDLNQNIDNKEQNKDLKENKIIDDIDNNNNQNNENIENQNIIDDNNKKLIQNQKNIINQNEGEQNELLNYYKNKQDSQNYNENENAQENNEKKDLNISANKHLEEVENHEKIEKNQENEDLNINETEQNEELKIKYVNLERDDDTNDKNEEQNILNNRNDELENKEGNNYEENQNNQQNQKLNMNMNNIDQTENEVAENINSNLNQNNINESSKINAEVDQNQQNEKFNKDLQGEEGEKEGEGEGEEIGELEGAEEDVNNEQYYEGEEQEQENEIKNKQEIEQNKNTEIKNQNGESPNKYNDEDEEIKKIREKIDQKLDEIERGLFDDDINKGDNNKYNEENNNKNEYNDDIDNNNNNDLNMNHDNDNNNNIENENEEEGNQDNENKNQYNSLNDFEKKKNKNQSGFKGSKRFSEGKSLRNTQKLNSKNNFKFPQSGELLFDPKTGKRRSFQPLFNKYELLRFTQKQTNSANITFPLGESIYQKAVEIFPSKYGIEMPYRSQLRQSNYSIKSLEKSSNRKRIMSENKSKEITEFNEEGFKRDGSGSIRKSQFKLKNYGKYNYYMYKGIIRSDNPFKGLSLYDKTTKKRKSLIAQTVKKEGNEYNEIILIEGNILKKKELGDEELNKLINTLSRFLYEDAERNLENRDSYEYKINKVSNIIKVMNEEEQNKALEKLENKAKDEYSKELFEKLKIKVQNYKEKIVKRYRSEDISENEESRHRYSSSRKKMMFKKYIK